MKTINTTLRNKNGDAIFEKKQILDRQVEYIGEVFNDNRPEVIPETSTTKLTVKYILKSEIESAIKSMRSGKATGNDKISKELIEAFEDLGTEKILDFANSTYISGVMPSQMNSPMSHLPKIILRVIMKRMKKKIYAEVSWSQFGFKKKKGTRSAVFVMRTLAERSIEMQKNLHVVFNIMRKPLTELNIMKL